MQPSVSITKPQELPSDWAFHWVDDVAIPSATLPPHWDDWELSLGIDTRALMYAVMHVFDLNPSSHPPPKLSKLTAGAYNEIFVATVARVDDDEGFRVVIRIPSKNDRLLGRMEANVALMTYAKYCLGLPVPQVIAWCDGTKEGGNPVGAPYIFMEHLDVTDRWRALWEGNTSSEDIWYRMMDITADGHARLARPLPFDGFGSLYFGNTTSNHIQRDGRETVEELKNPETYRLGPLVLGTIPLGHVRSGRGDLSPCVGSEKETSLVAWWKLLWKREVEDVRQKYENDLGRPLAWIYSSEDLAAKDKSDEPILTLSSFLHTADNLLKYIENCPLPSDPALYKPCLVPMDYAMRNLAFDDDVTRITAILDWDDTAILPFILCSKYLAELYPDRGDEEWEKETGGFRTIQPPVAEGVSEEELKGVFRDRIYSATGGRRGVQEEDTTESYSKGDVGNVDSSGSEDDDEDEEDGDDESDHEVDPEEEKRLMEEMDRTFARYELVFHDHFRKEYRKRLERLDPRFATPGFWKVAEDAQKIHQLVTHGAEEWMYNAEWIALRAGQLTKGKLELNGDSSKR